MYVGPHFCEAILNEFACKFDMVENIASLSYEIYMHVCVYINIYNYIVVS